MVYGFWCVVCGVWCMISGLDFQFSEFGLELRVPGLKFRVSGFGFRISGFGCLVSGFGFRVPDLASGFRFRVPGLASCSPLIAARAAPRADVAHTRQSRPDHGPDFQVKGRKTFQLVPSLLGSGVAPLADSDKAPHVRNCLGREVLSTRRIALLVCGTG